MTYTVLVPLDGSPLSEHALPLAAALARADERSLLLVHARAAAAPANECPPDLEAIAGQLRAEGLAVKTATVPLATPEQTGAAILTAAADAANTIIVMATHGYGGLGRWLYGSVADQVLRQASCPVMLVTPPADRAWPTDRPLRVLVPLDGSARAEAILAPLRELLQPSGGQVLLLRVSETVDYIRPHGDQCAVCRAARAAGTEPDIEPVRSRHYLEEVAGRLRTDHLTVEVQVETGNPVPIIVRAAEAHQADVIALATHGRTGLSQVIMGSVATETLRRAGVPVLLVRSSEVEVTG
ncbi:MAG: universal stress protein [Chloroflexota bacterium]